MGKSLRQQRAGKGGSQFRSPGHLHVSPAKYPPLQGSTEKGIIVELLHDPGRYVPLAHIKTEGGTEFYVPAAEGSYVGQEVEIGPEANPSFGNILPLYSIPEGTSVFNVELRPGDGGKLARQSGSYALVLGRSGEYTRIRLPSKVEKFVKSSCRATVGVPAGAGRIEKPLLKAGNSYYKSKAKATKFPTVRGVAMNVVSHPFGGGSHQHEGKPTTTSRNAPPGRKVGHIAARRTGRKKK
ncbi:MAG: 50S ribosomal protein L2 [Caldisphaeraceae archaeon]|nr:50S ribosomal protein L2 [Caldisphaeraceae archaeon]